MHPLREKVLNLIESLKKEESAVILVEGLRDCAALRTLGVLHAIQRVSGTRVFDDISQFEGKNVIILTDFDRTGQKLYNALKHELEVMGFKPNTYYWQTFKRITKGEIKGIEELVQFSEE